MARQCEKICNDIESQTDPETVLEWRAVKNSWEHDPSKPDPYKLAEKRRSYRLTLAGLCESQQNPLSAGKSLDAVKKKLADSEALEATAGASLPHKLHPSSFVRMGLEIEDQQYVSCYNS